MPSSTKFSALATLSIGGVNSNALLTNKSIFNMSLFMTDARVSNIFIIFSVLTGEVLLNVQTRKTILSYGSGGDVFRFIEEGTQLVEVEDGVGNNESVTYATRSAIEAGVLELIYQGHDRGFWKIEEGHRHPHQTGGVNELHEWYDEVSKVTGNDDKPLKGEINE